MRSAVVFLVAITLSIGAPAAAQVSVTAPAAGKESSYRKTTISWAPIPGATSYHLEIDDDPNFGSPEVDVTVAGTSYTLSGQRLRLNGQQSWAAYVRINGTRWNASTFTPSYFKVGANPALGVDSQNLVYLAFNDQSRVNLTKSSDWSSEIRLSLEDTFNTYGLHLAVDEFDVAHASWMEQRAESWGPYYTNSSTGWNLVRIPGTGTMTSGCSEGSLVAGDGQVDIFYDACNEKIERWTTTDGLTFARTPVPNNDDPTSASAARDGVGNLYVASERVTPPDFTIDSALQTSADGWLSHRLGPGRFPTLTVTPSGELHVLRWGDESDSTGIPFFYSNSLRGFQTWTELPVRTSSFDQDLLPLVVDGTRQQLHTVLTPTDGVRLCSSAHTGLANSTGTSWSCRKLDTVGYRTDVAVAPDGTIHVAWGAPQKGLGYANSLGSFLATNFTPQVSFGTPSGGTSAVTVPATISDADGDEMAGHIHVGRYQPVMSVIEPGTTENILDRPYTLRNVNNSYLYDPVDGLRFRVVGSATWVSELHRSGLTLPVQVEVRSWNGQILGGFFITAWDGTGATIVQNGFVPYAKLTFSGALPSEIDISTMPAGAAMLAIGVSDRLTSSFAAQAFTKTSGQTRLLLTKF
jgi:hypothetical protein